MGARVRGLLVMMTLPLLQRQLEVLMERHRPNARACGVVAGAGAVWGRWNAATTAVLNAMWARAARQAVAGHDAAGGETRPSSAQIEFSAPPHRCVTTDAEHESCFKNGTDG